MMRTRAVTPLMFTSFFFLIGCGTIVSLGGGEGGSGSGVGGGGGSSPSTTAAAGGTGGSVPGATSSTGPSPCPIPAADADGDGFTIAQGDCDDCNPLVNPNAVEAPTEPGDLPIDDDCDQVVDNLPATCDGGLSFDDADPMSGAKAVDLCKVSAGPNSWGVVGAAWVLPDGSPANGVPNFDVGHGILSAFGPNVTTKKGARMLALSSGTARQPTDPGYQDVNGFSKGYLNAPPPGFPKPSPACPGVTTGDPNDGAALELQIRTPSNAVGFAFEFDFYTSEWPNFVCSPYNDVFVALLSPIPSGQMDGNISFDAQGNIVSVNNVFLEACGCDGGPPCVTNYGNSVPCGLGTSGLVGTGFDTHGATNWLVTSAPVEPNGEITIRWGVYDSGDGILDTTTLVDNWHWLTSGSPNVSTYR